MSKHTHFQPHCEATTVSPLRPCCEDRQRGQRGRVAPGRGPACKFTRLSRKMRRTVPGERTIIPASGAGSHRHQTAEEEGSEERRGRGQEKVGEGAERRSSGPASERHKHQPEVQREQKQESLQRVGVSPRRPFKYESGHIKDLRSPETTG